MTQENVLDGEEQMTAAQTKQHKEEKHCCVSLNCFFHPSTSSTPSVRADSSS